MSKDPKFRWLEAVLASDLPKSTKHLLVTLSTHMTPAGENCFPSIRRTAAEMSVGKKTVTRHIKKARKLGWIEVTQKVQAGKKWKRNYYIPSLPDDWEKHDYFLDENPSDETGVTVTTDSESGVTESKGGVTESESVVTESESGVTVTNKEVNSSNSKQKSNTEAEENSASEKQPGSDLSDEELLDMADCEFVPEPYQDEIERRGLNGD